MNRDVMHCKGNKEPGVNEPQRLKRCTRMVGRDTEIVLVMREPPSPPSHFSTTQKTKIAFCLTNEPALT